MQQSTSSRVSPSLFDCVARVSLVPLFCIKQAEEEEEEKKEYFNEANVRNTRHGEDGFVTGEHLKV